MDPFSPIFAPRLGTTMSAPPPSPAPAPAPAPWQQMNPLPYGVEIPNRIFVGGCPYNMTEMELSKFFSQYGDVKDAKIITDRDGGKSKGYGFVTFSTEEEATRVHTKGSLYYQQKKLNVSKAVRKYGGQFQKANQEYLNGQQQMIWMQPNGSLVSNEGAWSPNQFSPHAQPVKPLYPMVTSPGAGYYYPSSPAQPQPPPPTLTSFNRQTYYPYPPHPGYNTTSSTIFYESPSNQGGYPHDTTPHHLVSTITTTSSDGTNSLESSGTSSLPPEEGEGEGEEKCAMKALEIKTKELSLDSAYTSEADLDTSHTTFSGAGNVTTNTDSGNASPTPKEEIQDSSTSSKTPSNSPSNDEDKNKLADPKQSPHHLLGSHGDGPYVMSPPYNGMVRYCYPNLQHPHTYPLSMMPAPLSPPPLEYY